MNSSINFTVKAVAPNSPKGTTFNYKTLKTQTNLDLSYEKKDRATIEFRESLAEDLANMGFSAEPIGPVTVVVSDAQAIGRIINRSVKSLSRIGVVVAEIGWDDDGGLLEFTIEDGTVIDLPPIVDLISRITFRASAPFTSTRHPLSLYDLKQTCGLVSDAKDELGGAQDTLDWFTIRELAVLEEEKKAKAEAKAKTKAAKAKVKDESKEVKKAAAKAKAKAKKAAAEVAPEGETEDPNE